MNTLRGGIPEILQYLLSRTLCKVVASVGVLKTLSSGAGGEE